MAFTGIGSFEWDSNKNEANKKKHGIAFEDASEIFEGPYLRLPTNHSSETRWIGLGRAQGLFVAVIYTERAGRIRIISARAARRYEREIYHQHFGNMS